MANGNFGGGSGNIIEPYLVEDAQDFVALYSQTTKHYKQTQDIDLSGVVLPVTTSTSFRGSYNGDNHRLTGITLKTTNDIGSLFYSISGASIKNMKITVNIAKPDIDGVSTLAYKADKCTIFNVHADGNLVGHRHVGGIVSHQTSGLIRYCSFTGTIASMDVRYSESGGIVGRIDTGTVQVESCWFDGNISGSVLIGGIVGHLNFRAQIHNCYSKGTINTNKSSCGGISGVLFGLIKNCYSTANIISTSVDNPSSIGGIAGSSGSANNKIENCFYLGDYISRASGVSNYGFGDILGSGNAIIMNCYSLDTLEFREG